MSNNKTRYRKAKKLMSFLHDKRAVSVALTTMIITAGVIAAGIAVLYWATSWGNVANQEYSETVANGQNSIQERLAYEYVAYSRLTGKLAVYLINNGMADNVSIARVYIWGDGSELIGTFTPDPPGLMDITDGTALVGNSLAKGQDAYFTVTVQLSSGYHSFRVVTERGRNFDGSFFAP